MKKLFILWTGCLLILSACGFVNDQKVSSSRKSANNLQHYFSRYFELGIFIDIKAGNTVTEEHVKGLYTINATPFAYNLSELNFKDGWGNSFLFIDGKSSNFTETNLEKGIRTFGPNGKNDNGKNDDRDFLFLVYKPKLKSENGKSVQTN